MRSFRRSDAAFNVGFALAALSLLPVGVFVAIPGEIFSPNQIRKDRALGRFVTGD
jgi:L-asparaginase